MNSNLQKDLKAAERMSKKEYSRRKTQPRQQRDETSLHYVLIRHSAYKYTLDSCYANQIEVKLMWLSEIQLKKMNSKSVVIFKTWNQAAKYERFINTHKKLFRGKFIKIRTMFEAMEFFLPNAEFIPNPDTLK